MIDGSEKRNRQLAFELQNSHVCEKRTNTNSQLGSPSSRGMNYSPIIYVNAIADKMGVSTAFVLK